MTAEKVPPHPKNNSEIIIFAARFLAVLGPGQSKK